jgi:hypothetical protein
MAAHDAGPWPEGMNNIAPDDALPVSRYGRTTAVRNAVNVDVDETGQMRRRKGYSKIFSGFGVRGAYSCDAGVFFLQGTGLYMLQADNSATKLCDGVFGTEVTYEYFNGAVYFSDGRITKRIVNGVAYEWGQDVPAQPLVSQAAGEMYPGKYLVAITTLDGERESGASEVVEFTLDAPGGLRVTNLPTNKTTRIYVSPPNGTTLYLTAEVFPGTVSRDITALLTGKPLDLLFMIKPPAGRIIRHFNGRMYIADGKTVWYTEPFSLEHVHPGRNFIQFTEPVTVMEPVESGLWIVSGKTEFFQGNGPEDFRPETKLEYGALYGTSHVLDRTKDALWYSEKGIVMGGKDGQATNLQEKNIAADSGSAGAVLVREQDGVRQMVVSVQNPTVSPLAASSFIEMEVVRKAGA